MLFPIGKVVAKASAANSDGEMYSFEHLYKRSGKIAFSAISTRKLRNLARTGSDCAELSGIATIHWTLRGDSPFVRFPFKLVVVGEERAKVAFVEPMLLLRMEKLPEGREGLYELKFDGYRSLAIKSWRPSASALPKRQPFYRSIFQHRRRAFWIAE
jgi:hypothetical protein